MHLLPYPLPSLSLHTSSEEGEEQEEQEKQTGVYCGGGFRVEGIRVGTLYARQKGVRDRSGGTELVHFSFIVSSKCIASSRAAELQDFLQKAFTFPETLSCSAVEDNLLCATCTPTKCELNGMMTYNLFRGR